MMNITGSIPTGPSTPLSASTIDAIKSDAWAAKQLGLPRDTCPRFPHEGMRAAWLEGWDSAPDSDLTLAKRFETGGPLLGGGGA